jgi:hypothetical protein
MHVQCVVTNSHYSLVGIDILHKHAALTALHNSKARSPAPKCYPNTRIDVMEAIMEWISNVDSQDARNLLWLHGPLGSGKSTVAQTVAERCIKNNRKLAGSFFFSSAASDRNTDSHLVATIAHQLTHSIPGVDAVLGPVIKANPSIFESSLEDQIESLIVKPLMQAVQGLEPYTWPYLVIVDGVDECTEQTTQRDIIRAIGTAINDHELPLRFIITSRPEPHLKNLFNSREIKPISKQISLQDPHFDTETNIEHYLRSELARISEGSLENAQWPTELDIRNLLDKSRGQFLYPSMIIDFIDNPECQPNERLQTIMDVPTVYNNPTSPFAELGCVHDILGPEHVKNVLTVDTLGRPHQICIFNRLLLDSREALFGYLHTLSTERIRALLQDVHAVWKVHTHRIQTS